MRPFRHAAVFSTFLLSCASWMAHAGKVLVFTTPLTKSHAMNLKKMAEELSQERGHEITYVAMEPDVQTLQPTSHPIVSYRSYGQTESVVIPEFRLQTTSTDADLWSPQHGLLRLMEGACMGLMENSTALDLIKGFGADLMLAEMFNICTALLAHGLDLPWVNSWPCAPVEPHSTSLWPESNRRLFQPNPLSYFPQHLSGIATQHMNLWERLRNLYHHWGYLLYDWQTRSGIVRSLYKRYSFDPTLPEERRRLVLTISPIHWAAEWLRPVSPNFKLVGPILAGPGNPLPEHIEAFMAEAHPGKNGVLLASLGTIAELDQQELVSMAADFGALPCKVLWRLTPKEVPDAAALKALNLSDSVQILTWVPQNDVLAHPNLRAFLSHVGINSMYEAIYHGRPIIAMPFFGDQSSNADRVVAKGIGSQISKRKIKSPAFSEAILAVLTDARYTEAAKALSIKIRARKDTPVQEAADWIEHVLATGGEAYLKTPEDELPFLVRTSLDVYVVLLLCCLILALLAWKAIRLLGKRIKVVLGSRLNPAHGKERFSKKGQ